jgi:predicted phosphodiesterase
MRLHILGDLHLEFGTAKVPVTDADVVVLAGDIHLGREGRKWARSHFQDKPVVYVLGNHEFYRHSLPDLTETLKRETDGSHIHLLENSAVEIDGYVIGSTRVLTNQRGYPDQLCKDFDPSLVVEV